MYPSIFFLSLFLLLFCLDCISSKKIIHSCQSLPVKTCLLYFENKGKTDMFRTYYGYYILGHNTLRYDCKLLYAHDMLQDFSTRHHIQSQNGMSLRYLYYCTFHSRHCVYVTYRCTFLHTPFCTQILYQGMDVFFISTGTLFS